MAFTRRLFSLTMKKVQVKTPFQESLPLLITSLVNKTGSIGISLLPMLLVQGGYSTFESSLTLGLVKSVTLFASLIAGFAGDQWGLRLTLLSAFFCSALGFSLLPFSFGLPVLIFAGMLAQFGNAATNSTLRLLLAEQVSATSQKEALGWMRTVNNLGQIVSFGIATLSSWLGLALLIWFDALTSFMAFLVGGRILPKTKPIRISSTRKNSFETSGGRHWYPFIGAVLILFCWNFHYEFFMVSVAGKLKLLDPENGVQRFSTLMLLNTALCTLLSVRASRTFQNVIRSLSVGVILNSSGLALCLTRPESLPLLWVGTISLTFGEIIYGVFTQLLVMKVIPPTHRPNTVYSLGIVVANIGRLLAASLAFPISINASNPGVALFATLLASIVTALCLGLGQREFREALA